MSQTKNMRLCCKYNTWGGWNGLRVLVSIDCLYGYYIYCFAHHLQLALFTASKEVIIIHHFFTKMIYIINIFCDSCNCNEELKSCLIKLPKSLVYMIKMYKLKCGTKLNYQIVALIYNVLKILIRGSQLIFICSSHFALLTYIYFT